MESRLFMLQKSVEIIVKDRGKIDGEGHSGRQWHYFVTSTALRRDQVVNLQAIRRHRAAKKRVHSRVRAGGCSSTYVSVPINGAIAERYCYLFGMQYRYFSPLAYEDTYLYT